MKITGSECASAGRGAFLGSNIGSTTPAERGAAFRNRHYALPRRVERAVARLKTWLMLSEEGGRYRAPISKCESMLQAAI